MKIGRWTVRLRPAARRVLEEQFPADPSSSHSIMLTGFAHGESRARAGMWEPETEFADTAAAEAAAKEWLLAQGPDAEVEVIDMSGKEGRVIEVVTRRGIEQVTSL